MQAIFISYRREDAEGQAGRLFDDLVSRFGEDSVFMDVTGIEPGRDFRRAIDEQVASCGVLLAVIGKSWLAAKDESGRRRLDDPLDFVRIETASALKRDIPVIPVLVHGANMPRAEQLPPDVAELAYRNAVELTHARWDSDVEVLIRALRPHVGLRHKVFGYAMSKPTVGMPGKMGTTTAAGHSGGLGAAGAATGQAAKSARRIVAMSAGAIAVVLLAVGSLWRTQPTEGPAVTPPADKPAVPMAAETTGASALVLARVRIGTVDGPADVYEDGVRVGTTAPPFEKDYPVGSRVVLTLRREDYKDERVEFEVREIGNEFLGFQLQSKGQSQ